jgi:TrmH family RNA methyltransferase
MSALAFNNSKVQQLRRLLGRRSSRYDDGCFVVEGPVLTAEAVAAGLDCQAQFWPEGVDDSIPGAGRVYPLAEGVLERVASTKQPQPPLTLVAIPDSEQDSAGLLAEATFVLVLDEISDPGNAGTIMRSAEAAGADLVVLTPGSVDQYNPKVVRASAGALFHVPVVTATVEEVADSGLQLFGSTSHDVVNRTTEAYTSADLTGRIALVMGNEAAGLPEEWTDSAGPINRWITIPHSGRSESLNVAMATTVLAFEAARQRSNPRSNPLR